MHLRICTLRAFGFHRKIHSFPIAVVFLFVCICRCFPLHRPVNVKSWTVNQTALSRSSFTKDLSRVSISNSTWCLNTGIENNLHTTAGFLVPPGGIFFQLLSYRREDDYFLSCVWSFCFGGFCTVPLHVLPRSLCRL